MLIHDGDGVHPQLQQFRAPLQQLRHATPRNTQAPTEAHASEPLPRALRQLRTRRISETRTLGCEAHEIGTAPEYATEARVRHGTTAADVQLRQFRAVGGDALKQRIIDVPDAADYDPLQLRAAHEQLRDCAARRVVAPAQPQGTQALAMRGGGQKSGVGDVVTAVDAQLL